MLMSDASYREPPPRPSVPCTVVPCVGYGMRNRQKLQRDAALRHDLAMTRAAQFQNHRSEHYNSHESMIAFRRDADE
jgi:hypothetical protein